MVKGITLKEVEVKSEPLEDDKHIIGKLAEGEEIEIDVKDFGYYFIKYNDGFAYVKEDGIKEI